MYETCTHVHTCNALSSSKILCLYSLKAFWEALKDLLHFARSAAISL